MGDVKDAKEPAPGKPSPGTSAELVLRVRDGDTAALDTLCGRYRTPLVRWAHGRLPAWARERLATEDLVQEVLIALARRVPELEIKGPGAIEAYLRVAVDNRLRDEVRRARHRPELASLPDGEIDAAPSPLQQAIGQETLERYEAALAALPPEARGLVIARLELEMSYAEIAEAFGRPSADAARMSVSRALVRIAEEMARHG